MADYPRLPGPGASDEEPGDKGPGDKGPSNGGPSNGGPSNGGPSNGGPSNGGPSNDGPSRGGGSDNSDAGHRSRKDNHRGRQRRFRGHVPQVRQILEAMAQLPQFVMVGNITPAQCNAMLAVMKTILAQLQTGPSTAASSQGLPRGLKDAIRQNPELFNFLAAWLSAEQLAELIDEEEGHEDHGDEDQGDADEGDEDQGDEDEGDEDQGDGESTHGT